TLLNALAGRALSTTGLERPTTRQVVVYARRPADASNLVAHVGVDNVAVVTAPEAEGLDYLVLVDTPDTNTLPENQRLLSVLLERADVLLTVFPAHNPKLHDNLSFLQPTVRQLPPEAVWPVLNMVDRIPRQELERVIVPDFRRALAGAWGLQPERVYLISARASAPGAAWLPDEQPLHGVNEFAALRSALFRSLNKASQVVDRRLAQAEHLIAVLRADVAERLDAAEPGRQAADEGLTALQTRAREVLGQATRSEVRRGSSVDLHAGLYALLGARWWGPVGWLVTLWSLLLRASNWVRRLARPRSSLASLLGEGADDPAPSAGPWAQAIQRLYAAEWPPIADALVQADYEPSVRQTSYWQERAQAGEEALRAQWAQAYQAQLERLAARLSSWLVQLLFNAPTMGLLGYLCVETLWGFFVGEVQTGDYFRQAGIALATVWLASFILLQAIVSLAARGMLRRRLARELADAAAGTLVGELRQQLAALEALRERRTP
ncbi:MAG: hypothetical protein GX557_10860, partial [Chloroflexi bacterium]|nr:hypothetical protein [Chloroflexota bacterium]